MTTKITFNKTELLVELQAAYEQVSALVETISDQQLYASKNEKWSIGENLEHLILSSVGVSSVLKQPKSFFKNFGKPKGPSRTYEVLYQKYIAALATGIKAPPAFSANENSRKTKEELLNSWRGIDQKFAARIKEAWTEEDLEKYGIPHPAIGLLTVREMLYFTIFHTKHHLAAMQKLV